MYKSKLFIIFGKAITNKYYIMEHTKLVSLVNQNFRIQLNQSGLYRNYLIGAGQYHKYLDDQNLVLTKKHFKKAMNSTRQVIQIQLRRGLKIKFYTK